MIFWDANSTSKLRPAAIDAVSFLMSENKHLNPSSIHQSGRYARAVLRESRDKILNYLFPDNKKIARLIFTSGGTESCNSIINGFIGNAESNNVSIVSSGIEHSAILEPLKYYQSLGAKVDFINSNLTGEVDRDTFLSAVNKNTSLATIMLANNETGVIQAVSDLAREIKRIAPSCIVVSDISQAISKYEFSLEELLISGVDAVALSAHKLGAMPGAGAVIFNTQSTCQLFYPQIRGGGQEEKLRGGTESLYNIYAFGEVSNYLSKYGSQELNVRKTLLDSLINEISNSGLELEILNFDDKSKSILKNSLTNTLYLKCTKQNVRADDLVVALDLEGLMVSTGSACSSGRQDVSHVPLAMGYDKEEARKFFRISLDWDSNIDQIKEGVGILKRVLERF